jgi:hypothetical protein
MINQPTLSFTAVIMQSDDFHGMGHLRAGERGQGGASGVGYAGGERQAKRGGDR